MSGWADGYVESYSDPSVPFLAHPVDCVKHRSSRQDLTSQPERVGSRRRIFIMTLDWPLVKDPISRLSSH